MLIPDLCVPSTIILVHLQLLSFERASTHRRRVPAMLFMFSPLIFRFAIESSNSTQARAVLDRDDHEPNDDPSVNSTSPGSLDGNKG